MEMDQAKLFGNIKKKKSFLCIGLDTELEKIPAHIRKGREPLFEFNRQIIDATHKYCIAYKPNVAFYECHGAKGWKQLDSTVRYIKEKYPDIMVIADAKRGDIGNTSKMYAKTFFETMPFDAVTVAPYMGEDSVTPFLAYEGKWVVLLALTSNKGADDFQYHSDDGIRLFERVLNVAQRWGSTDNLMFVVGATRAVMLRDIRKLVPEHFLLVPGVGAQGGSLEEVSKFGMTGKCGLLVNSSRAIIFASDGQDFAAAAAEKARETRDEMQKYLIDRKVIQ